MNKKNIKVGVLTSGGDAPGMNAAVRAVVRTAIYHKYEVFGIERGYNGLINDNIKPMDNRSVANIIQRGGTILKTARSKDFMTKAGRQKAYNILKKNGINALVIIGGDGSFAGATIFSKEYNINCIGVPGTIDNDMVGTDYTIGFDTATNTAIEAIDKIRDTAEAHDRLFIVEVMGRNSGSIALHCGIATGAENILIPETTTNVENILKSLHQKERRKKLVNLLVIAEGNQVGYEELEKRIKKEVKHMEIRATSLGHIQRGGAPSCKDRVLATRMGYASILAIVENKKNIMIGVKNNDIFYTKLYKTVKRKDTIDKGWIKVAKVLAT